MSSPLPSGPSPSDAADLLRAAAVPLLRLRQDQRVEWLNPAAEQALGLALGGDWRTAWADGAKAQALCRDQTAQAEMQAGNSGQAWYLAQSSPLPGGGWLVTLQACAELRSARARVEQQAELLDLAREFGRLGVWERNVRTQEGRWDRQVLRFWGLDPNHPTPDFEAAGRNIVEEDREPVIDYIRRSQNQAGSYSARFRVRGQGGIAHRIHSQWLVKNGADGQPERMIGLMTDDSEPYALAQSATELESQLALAAQLGEITIWRHDLASARMHYNAQGWKTLGMAPRPEGLTLEQARALIHPVDLPRVIASAEAAMRSPDPVDLEARYRHADGSWRLQHIRRTVLRDEQGQAIAFLGVALDITDSRRSNQALRMASERMVLAAQGAGLGTWEQDLQSGELIWSDQMWSLRGFEPRPGSMSAEQRSVCVHPDDLAAVLQRMEHGMAEGSTLSQEFRVVWPDGQVRWLASRSSQVVDPDSGRKRRTGVNWDITDNRGADIVRQEREIALRESAAKSKFLARMSHELRTPLNAVLGFTQLLQSEEAGDDAASQSRQRRLQHIGSAGQHLLALITEVLDLSGVEGGELRVTLEPVALQEIVEQTLPLLGPAADDRGVRVELGALDFAVMAQPTRLRQVLLNLLSNAVKFNRQGGKVRIAAQRQGDTVRVQVSDTGRGMSQDQLRQLFEPFNRLGAESPAADATEGTGIGLAIVKALMERMGGSVQVHSRQGEGSVFELHLTAANPDSLTARPDPAPVAAAADTPKPPARHHSVLYIEDNPVNAMIISELLARRNDVSLHIAIDGADGVRQALALLPDLILLDMQLPDCDGFEVLSRLRAQAATADIPCVALSANAMQEDIARALAAGMADYWTKPLDFRVFTASLNAQLDKAVR